jgi:O-antigen ligase
LVAAQYSSTNGIALWISSIFLAVTLLLPTKTVQLRAVDWSVLLLGAFEMPSLLFSQFRANSIRGTVTVAIFVLTYYAVRLTIQTTMQRVFLSGLLGLGGGCLALSGASQFDEHVKVFAKTGLTNLVVFRSKLITPPSPWITGEWLTLLLLMLPFAFVVPIYLLSQKRKSLAATTMVVPALIIAALCLSLSRAIFWSIVVFCVVLCVFLANSRLTDVRTAGMLFGTAIIGLILILVAESGMYPGLLKAYLGQQTSQVRSTQGRLDVWKRSMEVVRAHPLWGVGSGNAALALTSTADHEETTGFASRTFSLPVQVLIEKGIVGFLIYCSFLTLVAREFIRTMRYSPLEAPVALSDGRKKSDRAGEGAPNQAKFTEVSAHKAMACCFAAGLVAVVFRELTYSSLFDHQLTLALVAMLSALVRLPESDH